MEDILLYQGKVAIAFMVFFIAFAVLFNRWKNFGFNRLYLLGSMILSFILPLITFTVIREVAPALVYFESNGDDIFTVTTAAPQNTISIQQILLSVYLAGVVFFVARLLAGHVRAMSILVKSRKTEENGIPLYIYPTEIHPFAFFSKVIVPETVLQGKAFHMILNHEMVHIREKHWLDNLTSEVLCAVQWFNPFAWMMKGALKRNLEFQADHKVIASHNAETYQMALVSMANTQGPGTFLTAINSSDLKTRIKMMKMKTGNKYAVVRKLAVLPLLAILAMGLSNKVVKTEFVQPEKNDRMMERAYAPPLLNASETGTEGEKVITGKVTDEKGTPIEGASIKVKGRNFGVITDKNGNYKIEIEPSDKTLIYQFLFNDIKEVNIDGKTEIDIKLKTDGNPATDGVFLHNSFRMRATNGALANPVYVVDGIEVADVNHINPDNIEKIDILKGESGIKFYGEKGKNGVVLITTKINENQSNKNVSGNGLIIGNINWINNQKYSSAQLTNALGIKNGTLYSRELVEKRISGDVTGLYLDNGYLFANISFNEKQKDNGIVDLDFTVFEGTQFKIGKIEIKNDKDGLVYELLKEIQIKSGDLFSRSNLRQSMETLLKYYKQDAEVDIEVNPLQVNTASEFNTVNLTFKINNKGKSAEPKVTRVDNSYRMADVANGINITGNGPDQPLYLVDGKEVKDISELKPADIESIEVLKDKSATDLYGEKGKNGVISIKLKQNTTVNPAITNTQQLRRAIAERIKYPVAAQEAGQVGKVILYVQFDRDGILVSISESEPAGGYEVLDEVVVVAYKHANLDAAKDGKLQLLTEEAKRIIRSFPKFDIPEYRGVWVRMTFNFNLQ